MRFFRKSPIVISEKTPPSVQNLELMVTLWPSFPHFMRFTQDARISGIRLNSAMMSSSELDHELEIVARANSPVPLYFDVKGRQLRVVEVNDRDDTLDITLNHPIQVPTPVPVLFKAGEDSGLLGEVLDDGKRLIFEVPPEYKVRVGESLHIRDKNLVVGGQQFTDVELEKIQKVRKAGFTRYFLSYVQFQRDVDEFRDLVGRDSEIMLKIESRQGLDYVASQFKKQDNLILVAARGDLYVEIDRPHDIFAALQLIVDHDPQAVLGSRILLSVVARPVPDCADFLELGWAIDHGYRNFMLCDEICLKEDLLSTAVTVFDTVRRVYPAPKSHL